MNKFTQGVWRINKESVGIVLDTEDQSDGMFAPICYIETYDFPDEWEHNARLIEKAPEMYYLIRQQSRLMHKTGFTLERDVLQNIIDYIDAAE